GLSLVGMTRNREPIVDFKKRKLLKKVWPKVLGGPIRIRAGGQEVPDGVVNWSPYMTFDPTTQRFVNTTKNGFALGVEFSSNTLDDWLLTGYTMEIARSGRY